MPSSSRWAVVLKRYSEQEPERAMSGSDGGDDGGLVQPSGIARMAMIDQECQRPPRSGRGLRRDPGRPVGRRHHLAPPDDVEFALDVRRSDGVEHAAAGAAGVEPQHQARMLDACRGRDGSRGRTAGESRGCGRPHARRSGSRDSRSASRRRKRPDPDQQGGRRAWPAASHAALPRSGYERRCRRPPPAAGSSRPGSARG